MSRRVFAIRDLWAPGARAALSAIILCAAAGIALAAGAAATGGTAPAADSAQDIRDIRGPQPLVSTRFLTALIAGAAVLALGGYCVWRRRRRRSARALLPFETALRDLEGLRELMQPAHAREFSTALSGIVRRYIEQGFDLTATLRTTEEFLRDLLELSPAALAPHRRLLSQFLHQCDLVKFAGVSLTRQSMEALHESACDFVQATAEGGAFSQADGAQPRPAGRPTHDSLPST